MGDLVDLEAIKHEQELKKRLAKAQQDDPRGLAFAEFLLRQSGEMAKGLSKDEPAPTVSTVAAAAQGYADLYAHLHGNAISVEEFSEQHALCIADHPYLENIMPALRQWAVENPPGLASSGADGPETR